MKLLKQIFLPALVSVSCLLILLFTAPLKAQNLDSLWAAWNDPAQPDTSRLKAMHAIAWDGYLFSQPDSAFFFAQMEYDLAEKSGLKKQMGDALNTQGVSFAVTADYRQALDYYQRSLKIREEIGDKNGIAAALNNIGLSYEHQGDYPKALDYNQRSLKIEEETGDKNGIASSLNNIGNLYGKLGKNPKALGYFERSLKIEEEFGDKSGIAYSLNNIGILYADQGDYPQALDHYQRSLKINEEIGDKNGIAASLGNIGMIYHEQDDYPQALDYYQKSLKIEEEIGDKNGIAETLGNIGSVYQYQGDYPKALDHYERSLKMREEIGDKNGMAASLHNTGIIYKEQGDYPQALDYYQRSLKIYEEFGDKNGIAHSLKSIGRLYQKQGKHQNAINECSKGLQLAQEVGDVALQQDACQCLYDVHRAMGNHHNALLFYEQMIAHRDSLFNEKNTKKLTQLEMQYEFDKKEAAAQAEQEKKNAIATQELRREKLIRNGFVGGFAVVLLFAGVFLTQRNRIGKEKKRSEELLLNILPEKVAEELKDKGEAEAQLIDRVTVLFTDFKGFTALSEKLSPKELVSDLNKCFSEFDRITAKYGIEKIKTIGDAYMAAGGLPTPNSTHAKDVIQAALEMRAFVEHSKQQKIDQGLPYFEVRIGIHTGPVVAGIVGVKKFQYDIWGDTVNTASRMESSGEVSKVNISEATYEFVKDLFTCEYRGEIEAKGKGKLGMYFVSEYQ